MKSRRERSTRQLLLHLVERAGQLPELVLGVDRERPDRLPLGELLRRRLERRTRRATARATSHPPARATTTASRPATSTCRWIRPTASFTSAIGRENTATPFRTYPGLPLSGAGLRHELPRLRPRPVSTRPMSTGGVGHGETHVGDWKAQLLDGSTLSWRRRPRGRRSRSARRSTDDPWAVHVRVGDRVEDPGVLDRALDSEQRHRASTSSAAR